MSDANRVAIGYSKEVTYGITPAVALKTLRYTGESLQQAIDTKVSEEIRSDRQTADFIRSGLRTNGDINFELSYGTYQDLFEYGLFSAPWTTPVVVTLGATTVAIATSGNNFTLTRSAGSWITDGILTTHVGRWVRTAGFAAANNNGLAKIVSVAATILTVTNIGMTAVGATATTTATLLAEILAGTTVSSISIERNYAEIATEFAAYTGQLINQISLNGTANGIMTGSFGFLGKQETSFAATIGTGAPVASYSTVTPVMNGIDNMEACFEGNISAALFSFTFQLQNNLRERLQMGTLGPISIATGQIGISGNIVVYFTSKTLADKFLNFTGSSLAFKFKDSSGNRCVWDIPQLKYSSGPRPAAGINQDVFLTMGFTGYINPTELQSFRIVRSDGP